MEYTTTVLPILTRLAAHPAVESLSVDPNASVLIIGLRFFEPLKPADFMRLVNEAGFTDFAEANAANLAQYVLVTRDSRGAMSGYVATKRETDSSFPKRMRRQMPRAGLIPAEIYLGLLVCEGAEEMFDEAGPFMLLPEVIDKPIYHGPKRIFRAGIKSQNNRERLSFSESWTWQGYTGRIVAVDDLDSMRAVIGTRLIDLGWRLPYMLFFDQTEATLPDEQADDLVRAVVEQVRHKHTLNPLPGLEDARAPRIFHVTENMRMLPSVDRANLGTQPQLERDLCQVFSPKMAKLLTYAKDWHAFALLVGAGLLHEYQGALSLYDRSDPDAFVFPPVVAKGLPPNTLAHRNNANVIPSSDTFFPNPASVFVPAVEGYTGGVESQRFGQPKLQCALHVGLANRIQVGAEDLPYLVMDSGFVLNGQAVAVPTQKKRGPKIRQLYIILAKNGDLLLERLSVLIEDELFMHYLLVLIANYHPDIFSMELFEATYAEGYADPPVDAPLIAASLLAIAADEPDRESLERIRALLFESSPYSGLDDEGSERLKTLCPRKGCGHDRPSRCKQALRKMVLKAIAGARPLPAWGPEDEPERIPA